MPELRSVSPPNTEPLLRWVFLAAIIVLTVVGLILGEALTSSFKDTPTTVVPIVLFAVGTSSLLLVRLVLLPQMARNPDVLPQALAAMGYAFAEAPATYGVVAAIMTGRGWVALPFGALAFAGWLVVKAFIAGHLAVAPEDFPRL